MRACAGGIDPILAAHGILWFLTFSAVYVNPLTPGSSSGKLTNSGVTFSPAVPTDLQQSQPHRHAHPSYSGLVPSLLSPDLS